MMAYFRSLVLVILVACGRPESTLSEVSGNFYLEVLGIDLMDVMINHWDVGLIGKTRISKGVSVGLRLPRLNIKDALMMNKRYGFDSFIIEASRSPFTAKFNSKGLVPLIGGDGRFRNISEAYVNLYYSATAISGRFENLSCPALGHNLKIKGIGVSNDLRSKMRKMMVGANGKETDRLEEASLRPIVFNFGKNLVGSYQFKIALFNSRTKTRLSNWINFPKMISVKGEEIVRIPGCTSLFKVPARENRDAQLKFFK